VARADGEQARDVYAARRVLALQSLRKDH